MQQKRLIGLVGGFFTLALLFILGASQVAAQGTGSPFGGIVDMIRNLLSPIFSINLGTADDTTLKLILAFILFPLLGMALSMVIKEKPKIAWTVAAFLTIMSVMAIPGSVIKGLAYTYATVFVFIAAAIPIAGLFLLMHAFKKMVGDHAFLYHWVYAAGTLIAIIVLNHMLLLFANSDEFFSNLQYESVSTKLPGFALGVLSLMLAYHVVAPFFKWGAPKVGGGLSTARGWFGHGLPSIKPSQGFPPAGGFGGARPTSTTPGGAVAGAQAAIGGAQVAAAQEKEGEDKEVELIKAKGRVFAEREKAYDQLSAINLHDLNDLEKIQNDLNALVQLTELHKADPITLDNISKRLQNIRPSEEDIKAHIQSRKDDIENDANYAGMIQQQIFSEAQFFEKCKAVMDKESIMGTPNYFGGAGSAEVQDIAHLVEEINRSRQEIFSRLWSAYQQQMAPLQHWKELHETRVQNITLMENMLRGFLAALQRYVDALKQTLVGPATVDPANEIKSASSVFSQFRAAILQEKNYDEEMQQLTRLLDNNNKSESALMLELSKRNTQINQFLQKASQLAVKEGIDIAEAANKLKLNAFD